MDGIRISNYFVSYLVMHLNGLAALNKIMTVNVKLERIWKEAVKAI
jgi:hypothetical protein